MWSAVDKGAIQEVWSEAVRAPTAWVAQPLSTPPRPEGVTDATTEAELAPRTSIASPDKVEELLLKEARLGERLDALKSQKHDLFNRDAAAPSSKANLGTDLLAGVDLAAQWLSAEEREAAARDEARRERQNARLWIGRMPPPPPRTGRNSINETMRVLRARERDVIRDLAAVEAQLCNESTRSSTAVNQTKLTPSGSLPVLVSRQAVTRSTSVVKPKARE